MSISSLSSAFPLEISQVLEAFSPINMCLESKHSLEDYAMVSEWKTTGEQRILFSLIMGIVSQKMQKAVKNVAIGGLLVLLLFFSHFPI